MGRISLNADGLRMAESFKADKEADKWFAEKVEEGFTSEDGITLGLTTEDVTLLTGNYVLAKEAASLELPLPPVIDMGGTSHQLDITELTTLMLAYGSYRAQLSSQLAAKKAAAVFVPPEPEEEDTEPTS